MKSLLIILFVMQGVISNPARCVNFAELSVSEEKCELTEVKQDELGMYAQDQACYQKLMAIGAVTVVQKGEKAFFVYWIPRGFEKLKEKHILVVLHGSRGNAYRHLMNFYETARKHNFGLVSLQWGWPGEEVSIDQSQKQKYVYLYPEATYNAISLAIKYLTKRYGIDIHGCAWQGFSKSSNQSALFAFYDKKTGNNYFRLFVACSGEVRPHEPEMKDLLSGTHGKTPIKGCHFYLWVSQRENGRVAGMQRTKELLESLGGVVEKLVLGPEGHSGFNRNLLYQDEAVQLWLKLSGPGTR